MDLPQSTIYYAQPELEISHAPWFVGASLLVPVQYDVLHPAAFSPSAQHHNHQ
jgi:hypothetical protein